LSQLFELIYISDLATNTQLTQVADILNRSRSNNALLNITGILVFDGSRFVQHFEGERTVVMRLFHRIEQDARHTDVRWLHDGPIESRHFDSFLSGYWHDDSADGAIANLQNHTGLALRTALHSHLEAFDLAK
jgi:hypothetical protein